MQHRNKAILGYLKSNGYSAALSGLEKELGEESEKKYEGMLERKWTAVTKLSAKV